MLCGEPQIRLSYRVCHTGTDVRVSERFTPCDVIVRWHNDVWLERQLLVVQTAAISIRTIHSIGTDSPLDRQPMAAVESATEVGF